MRRGMVAVRVAAVGVLLAVAGTACGPQPAGSVPGAPTPTTPGGTLGPMSSSGPPSPSPPPPAAGSPGGPVDPGLAGLVELARADLAARLAVPADEITVVSAEVVTWPDAGLGCRQPGREYPQVPVDGARILLAQAGRTYAYHAGGRSPVPFLCERPG